MAQNQTGRFVRWQATAIAQMGFVGNLILGLAVAALGFGLNSAKEGRYSHECWARCLLVLGCISILASISTGICWAVNRLKDFRITAQIAKLSEKWEANCASEAESEEYRQNRDSLKDKRAQAKVLDERTWTLFYLQLWTFGIGVLLLTVAFCLAYRAELFG